MMKDIEIYPEYKNLSLPNDSSINYIWQNLSEMQLEDYDLTDK